MVVCLVRVMETNFHCLVNVDNISASISLTIHDAAKNQTTLTTGKNTVSPHMTQGGLVFEPSCTFNRLLFDGQITAQGSR